MLLFPRCPFTLQPMSPHSQDPPPMGSPAPAWATVPAFSQVSFGCHLSLSLLVHPGGQANGPGDMKTDFMALEETTGQSPNSHPKNKPASQGHTAPGGSSTSPAGPLVSTLAHSQREFTASLTCPGRASLPPPSRCCQPLSSL